MSYGVKEAVIGLRKIYEDAYAGIINGMEEEADDIDYMFARREAASVALAALPVLNSKAACSDYVACISWLVGRNLMQGTEAKTHLYMAQVAMQALDAQQGKIIATVKKTEGRKHASKQSKSRNL